MPFKDIAIGVFIPFLLFSVWYEIKIFRVGARTLAALPFVFLFCGAWSILPRVLLRFPAGSLFWSLSQDPWNNIFFFYGILDKLQTGGGVWGVCLIFYVFFSVFLLYIRHLRLQEISLKKLREEVR